MKVLVAPDKFKGALSAAEASSALETGVKWVLPSAECARFPMADGGEGTMQALLQAKGGSYHEVTVHDPLMRRIKGSFVLLDNGQTAVVEMAAASGLALLPVSEQNCFHTTSFGTGELIKAALDTGVHHIMLALGGSATSDGGAGMAAALGAEFKHEGALYETPRGKDLKQLDAVDLRKLDTRLTQTKISLLYDVTHSLLGSNGAAATFAPQKGANSIEVEQLEAGLSNLVRLVSPQTKADPEEAGAGAAGGMGFGGVAFLGGRLHQGVETVLRTNGFLDALPDGDLVITGEGKLDQTSVKGKVISGVASKANEHQIGVVALCGALEIDARTLQQMGVTSAFSIIPGPMDESDALSSTSKHLTATAYQVMKLFNWQQRSELPCNKE